MDLNFSAEDAAFRDEVQRFVAEQLPADIRRKVVNAQRLEREDYLRWQRILHDARLGRAELAERASAARAGARCSATSSTRSASPRGAPRQIGFGLEMVAPVIMRFGTPAQQQRFLPRILDGDALVVPGLLRAGRGLRPRVAASTRAVRDGDHYVVNGQKTWTTLGAVRRLDLLPGAHRPRRAASRRASRSC